MESDPSSAVRDTTLSAGAVPHVCAPARRADDSSSRRSAAAPRFSLEAGGRVAMDMMEESKTKLA